MAAGRPSGPGWTFVAAPLCGRAKLPWQVGRLERARYIPSHFVKCAFILCGMDISSAAAILFFRAFVV